MVVQDDYIEALNDCIERLASGETMDSILGDYPTMANELRPMLEAGNLLSRVAYPLAEVTAAQMRLEPIVRQGIQGSLGGTSFGYWPLIVIIVIAGIIGIVWQANSQSASPESPSPTSEIIVEATAETIATEAMVASEITPEATPESTESPAFITIQGVVTAINANVITIYDMDIALEPSDPVLNVIQIGDNIRVEGEYEGGTTIILIAVTIVFVDVDVFVNEGDVWRDSGDCNNPPPPWAAANGWRRRCEGGGGGNGNGNGNGRGGSGRGRSGGS